MQDESFLKPLLFAFVRLKFQVAQTKTNQAAARLGNGETLQFAKGGGHRKPRGTNSWEEAAEYSHHQSKNNSLHEEASSDLESESEIGKGLKIDGAEIGRAHV